MNISQKTLTSALLAASFGLFGAGVWAQDTTPPMTHSADQMNAAGQPHHWMKGKHHMKGMKGMKGMHAMPATVTSVDKSTGVVEVTSGEMSLRVHFPPASVADLSDGDKITLHMGYSMAADTAMPAASHEQ